eukprot:PhM_4_TR8291/c0_g1_i1/m.40586/K11855/USP36_42; ubiquitin carboxyl-terminal hydrolase 36/42
MSMGNRYVMAAQAQGWLFATPGGVTPRYSPLSSASPRKPHPSSAPEHTGDQPVLKMRQHTPPNSPTAKRRAVEAQTSPGKHAIQQSPIKPARPTSILIASSPQRAVPHSPIKFPETPKQPVRSVIIPTPERSLPAASDMYPRTPSPAKTPSAFTPVSAARSFIAHDSPVRAAGYPVQPVRGLVNLGNTCYLNAVLAALRSAKVVYDTVIAAAESPKEGNRGLLCAALAEVFRTTVTPSPHPVAPSALLDTLRRLDRASFLPGVQMDAHETLIALMRLLENDGCDVHKKLTGTITVTVTCLSETCGHRVEVSEPFVALSLPVPHGPDAVKKSVDTILDEYQAPELVEHTCDVCGHKEASCCRLVTAVPEVLVLHLKRFQAASQAKTIAEVDVDTRLQMHSATYYLRAVVSHLGERIGSGHYICDFLHRDGACFTQDDTTITMTGIKSVLARRSRQSYLAVYTRL